MRFLPFAAVMTYRFGKWIFTSDALTWKEIENWISIHGDRGNYGRGFIGNQLPPSRASGAFVELQRKSMGNSMQVSASVFFEPGSLQPAASKIWVARKLDKKLEAQFGKNLRTRISI